MAKLIIFQNDYDTIDALTNVMNYVLNKEKASYIGAQNLLLDHDPLQQIFVVRKYWNDSTKKKILHFIIAFDDDFITMESLNEEAYNICSVFPEYQIAFAVHNSTGNLHLHMAIHPLNMATGRKLYFDNSTLFFFVQKLRDIFKKYDIRINYEFKYNNI